MGLVRLHPQIISYIFLIIGAYFPFSVSIGVKIEYFFYLVSVVWFLIFIINNQFNFKLYRSSRLFKYLIYSQLLFVLLVFSSNMIAQQVYGVQRGQRGYIPPPKYEASVYVTTINAYEELEKVLPKSVETFNLDDFEREIFKGLLLEKYDNYNRIVENTDSSKQARQEALKQLEIDFVKGLAVILTPDEISMFVDMDFSGKEEKRKKRKKRKNKKNDE